MIMKYIKPETKIVKVELQHMIAESNFDKFDGDVEDPRARDFNFFEEEIEEE